MTRWQKIQHHFSIWLAYAGLTILVTWPLAGRLGSHIPGSEGDTWVHQWTFRWVKTQLATGGDLFFTKMMYHPHGTSLLQHNFAWFHIAIWLPLQTLVGEATAYTLIFLFGFSFTAFTTYLLAKELTRHETAAFAAGLITGFWPYNLSHHNHPNLIFIGFIPLALLYTKRLNDQPNWQNRLRLAMAVALIGIVRWQLLALALCLLGGYWLYQAYQMGAERPRLISFVANTAVALTLSAVLMLPLAWPLIHHQISQQVTFDDLSADESRSGETDLLAYLTPSRYHPLWGEQAFTMTENFVVNKVFTPYLGAITLLLTFFALRYRWRESAIWLLLAAIYILLALGATLTINGRDFVTLPYLFLENSFFGALIRRPDRFNVILSIPFGILGAYGLIEIGNMPHLFARKRTIWVILCAFILFESLTIYPTYRLQTPVWYQQLAQEPEPFAILDLPIYQRVYDEQYMYYQFVHGKPLVGGHVSRPPEETFTFINSIPFLRDVGLVQTSFVDMVDVGRQVRLLADENVRYIVLHKRYLSAEQLAMWQDWLVMEPVHQDQDLVVYDTTIAPPIAQPLTTTIGLISSAVTPTDTAQGGRLELDIVWGSTAISTADLDVCFTLQNEQSSFVQTVCQPIAPDYPTSEWLAQDWVHATYDFPIDPYLAESGQYTLLASLDNQVGEMAPLTAVDIAVQPRDFIPPVSETTADIEWDIPIRLVGYDLNRSDLTLYWQAEGRIPASYAVFRHIVDPDTGELVGQVDGVPRYWTYPTNWWETAEYVRDDVVLPLDQLPRKEYLLFIGLYNLETNERVPVYKENGTEWPNSAVFLTPILLSKSP